jgi:hypothetical protein
MARTSDGRVGVSVNAGTVRVLDEVRKHMAETMGIKASYTQAIQYVAHEYFIQLYNKGLLTKDNLTDSQTVQQGE